MPRSAAKLMNKREKRLPVSIQKTTLLIQNKSTTENIVNTSTTTTTAAATTIITKKLSQQQTTQERQRKNDALNKSRGIILKSPTKRNFIVKLNKNFVKIDDKNLIISKTDTATPTPAHNTTPTTLYPIIEILDNSIITPITPSSTSSSSSSLSNVIDVNSGGGDITLNQNLSAQSLKHKSKDTTKLVRNNNNDKYCSSDKNENNHNKKEITSDDITNSRLATLRVRKITTTTTTTAAKTKTTKTNSIVRKRKLKKSIQQQAKTNEDSKFRNVEKVNHLSAAATAAATKIIATTAEVVNYLDPAVLNKIEVLEFEAKDSVKKRKRYNSLSTRKRQTAAAQKNCNSLNTNNDFAACNGFIAPPPQPPSSILTLAACADNSSAANFSNTPLLLLPPTTTPATSAIITAKTKKSIAETKANSSSNNTKKRIRNNMSLYDPRYQNIDDATGKGIVVTNGYPGHHASSSSTRNASSSSVGGGSNGSSTENAADGQQDISNQYYMSTSNASVNMVASSLNSNAAGVAANTINHAPSMATLCNIGNTCYLNSVVYTLRFAPQFLHNLHHLIVDLSTMQQNIMRQRAKSSSLGRAGAGGGITGLHMENTRSWSSKDLASLEQSGGSSSVTPTNSANVTQKTHQQLLTERLHELYQSLHRNEIAESSEPFHADTLLHSIQDVSSIFEGNQQQDAHEFLMCVLNSIRETCQTLIKAIAEYPDMISNGYICSIEDTVDAHDRDAATGGNYQGSSSGGNVASSSSSSLSTSNITKGYFFSRKSKRKEEAKNSKNSRLQSPLKDVGSNNVIQQPVANSLFYLNTVDLRGANPQSNLNTISTTTAATTLSSSPLSKTSAPNASLHGDGASDILDPSVLKDKARFAEKIRELGLDFFSEDFEGVTVSTTKCLSCETITEQKESMIDIAVPVPISGYENSDLTEKPSSFIQNSCITREYFRGENKYRCEQCTGYTEAIRSISYEVLPRLLVIQLSRFSGGMEKINSYIPTSFTLQCFCSKCCELSDANKLHIYKLYSVITHVGATMSVGHYIAYTCSLDCANEYVNCPKDRRSSSQQQQQQQQQQSGSSGINQNNNGSSTGGGGERVPFIGTSSAASAAASALASGTSLMKKMKFGRSKASSSGDMSKNVKNLNGVVTSNVITNGIGKLSMNTTCHSLNCCATRLSNVQQQQQQQQQQNVVNSNDFVNEESLPNGLIGNSTSSISNQYHHQQQLHNSGSINSANSMSYNNSNISSGYGSTGRGGYKSTYSSVCPTSNANNTEPIWYMCDDDKIKAMTQREFEDLLSPSRKITITPYLLFYARFDLQPTVQPTPPPPKQQQPSNVCGGGGFVHKI